MIYDVLIVGSGASAVNAAYPLVEGGLSVGMLDVGNQDQVYKGLVPTAPFLDVRKTDNQQHRYFLGDRFEGVPLNQLRVGPQLTPPRQYITRGTNQWTPVESTTFSPMSSLALGGMASGWSAGAFPYTQEDLNQFPISYQDLFPFYQRVAERIGISGEEDDLSPMIGELNGMLPPLDLDENGKGIFKKYLKGKKVSNGMGFYMGKTRLAALSQAYRNRGPEQYLDMAFWGDSDQSVWRPAYTLQEIQTQSNFKYLRPFLVHSFKEGKDGVTEVTSKNIETNEIQSHHTHKLVLGAGVLGTTRIVLRSLNQFGVRVPFVCNPYTYYPMINFNMFGKEPSKRTHSLAQLTVLYRPPSGGEPLIYGRVHSYRSLLNFKVIKEMPLPYREAMRVMKILVPNLAILALDHEDHPNSEKFCMLHPGSAESPDRMQIVYSLSDEVRKKQLKFEKVILSHFRRLGCMALKRVWPGYGTSLHYGGTLPMTHEEKELSTTADGLLRGTQSVYIVDSSGFPYLPAKAMTFTMMANADRIGELIKKEFNR